MNFTAFQSAWGLSSIGEGRRRLTFASIGLLALELYHLSKNAFAVRQGEMKSRPVTWREVRNLRMGVGLGRVRSGRSIFWSGRYAEFRFSWS
jgi:hypothetical protein